MNSGQYWTRWTNAWFSSPRGVPKFISWTRRVGRFYRLDHQSVIDHMMVRRSHIQTLTFPAFKRISGCRTGKYLTWEEFPSLFLYCFSCGEFPQTCSFIDSPLHDCRGIYGCRLWSSPWPIFGLCWPPHRRWCHLWLPIHPKPQMTLCKGYTRIKDSHEKPWEVTDCMHGLSGSNL